MKDNSLIQFKLMLPADLKVRLEAAASRERRSLSQEIVATLEEKYPPPSAPTEAELRLFVRRELIAHGVTNHDDPRYQTEIMRAFLKWGLLQAGTLTEEQSKLIEEIEVEALVPRDERDPVTEF